MNKKEFEQRVYFETGLSPEFSYSGSSILMTFPELVTEDDQNSIFGVIDQYLTIPHNIKTAKSGGTYFIQIGFDTYDYFRMLENTIADLEKENLELTNQIDILLGA